MVRGSIVCGQKALPATPAVAGVSTSSVPDSALEPLSCQPPPSGRGRSTVEDGVQVFVNATVLAPAASAKLGSVSWPPETVRVTQARR